MKKLYLFILIGAFLFPLTGQAFAASQPATTSVIDSKKAVTAALQDIFTQLTALSTKTQTTINQLNATGVATDNAQTAIIDANTTLAKAKIDIDAFSTINTSNKNPSLTLSTLKYTAITAENTLSAAKSHIIDSLTNLKASLPSL